MMRWAPRGDGGGRHGQIFLCQFGLRIGKGVNVPVSRLGVTHRLAPAKGGQ